VIEAQHQAAADVPLGGDFSREFFTEPKAVVIAVARP
jgi:hypothetical protein